MTDDIDQALRRALSARRPPDHMQDEASQERYISEIARLIDFDAPGEHRAVWVARLVERLGWAPPVTWRAALTADAAVYLDQEPRQPEPRKPDPRNKISPTDGAFDLFVRRIQKGEPVAEHLLFSTFANRALKQRLIEYEDLKRYQIAAAYRRREVYGDDDAAQFLRERVPALADGLAKTWARERAAKEAAERNEDASAEDWA